MMMVASSVVLTVVVLNYHHRTAETHVMPMWVRSVFLQWLPWILRMDRPREKITRKTIMMSNRLKELELKEKDSKSLMVNVLDMDDDFRWFGIRQSKQITIPPRPQSLSAVGGVGCHRGNGSGPFTNGLVGQQEKQQGTSKGESGRHNQSCSNLNGWGYLSSAVPPGHYS